jgi:transcriptional regulator with XRE-family HTH domain
VIHDADFALRFRLALLALGVSRTQAASLLGVDKSLVGRWASGAVRPTEHNLTRITALVAGRFPAFGLQDWHKDVPDFAAMLGLDPDLALAGIAKTEGTPGGLLLDCLPEARSETARRGGGYEGFWRTTRPSVVMDDRLFHDYGMIRRGASGVLEVTMGGAGLTFDGWALPLEGNLFMLLDGKVGFTPLFLIFRGVALPKVTRLDGLLLMATLDATRTPAAVPIVAERIGALSGDAEADLAHCRELGTLDPSSDAGDIDPAIREHLERSSGREAALAGGELFLMVSATRSLSRGSTAPGLLAG